MHVVHDRAVVRRLADAARASGRRVGFVPTMGALHEGHMTLVDEARRRADFVVVSVFVNPLQFGANEDLGKYPRTLPSDSALCAARGVDLVYAPDVPTMYPDGFATTIEVSGVTERLEGAHRPGHFRGVATVVAKLFSMVGPAVAIFGRKDYQQLRVIDRMTRDLDLPIEVVGMPTSRDSDGLARSSRNRYLDERARARALAIPRGIAEAASAYGNGVRDAGELARLVRAPIEQDFDSIDYIEVVHADTLEPLHSDEEPRVVLVAARVAGTRLIDNHAFGVDTPPARIP